KSGFQFSGLSPDGSLVEIIEIADHPFYLASQFHPEFQSKPNRPHPLFKGFIAAVHQHLHHKPISEAPASALPSPSQPGAEAMLRPR
ncbi:MAG: CTP synthase, partial [Verrucomicrobia bacterium]|nr:CTP synthase [Verrucomicrobiota bacterium]